MGEAVDIDMGAFQEHTAPERADPGRRAWYRDVYFLPVLALVYVVDQTSKALVRATMTLGQSVPGEGLFRITYTTNTGAAFSLLQDQTLLLALASLVGIGVLVVLYRQHAGPSRLARAALGMQLGGALGNLTDRLRLGHVTDFFDVGWWPVFNIADSAIVVGIAVLVAYVMWPRRTPRELPALPPPGATTPSDIPMFDEHDDYRL